MVSRLRNIRLGASWWVVMLQGIVVLLIGLLFLFLPDKVFRLMLVIFALYWLLSGIVTIAGLIKNKAHSRTKIWGGAIAIIASLLILIYPNLIGVFSASLLLGIFAACGIAYGLSQLALGRKEGNMGTMAVGIMSIIFGVGFALLTPIIGALFSLSLAVALKMVPLLLGLLGVIGGVFLIFHALNMRRGAQAGVPQV